MNKRKGIGKKIRFEVLKRDSFTCQYCGANPSVTLLEVDHIQPVARGGDNDMLNLITSCFDCNRGKSARELSDDSVVVKQKKQLDNLQERRQQLEMMLEWRKGLDGLKSETNLMVIEYIESKIKPYTINDLGKKKLERVINKYVLEEVLEAVTVAESRYLRFGDDEVLERSSVDNFITKITGILVNSKRSPVDQKVAYIIGICRNRFDYWNHKSGASLLKKVQSTMSSAGRADESVLEILTDTIQPMALGAKNWTQWKEGIEEFLETLEGPPTGGIAAPAPTTHPELDSHKRELLVEKVDDSIQAIERLIPALISVGSITNIQKSTHWRVCTVVLNYLESWHEYYLEDAKGIADPPDIAAEFNGQGLMSCEIHDSSLFGFRRAYYVLVGVLCDNIEDIFSHDKHEYIREEFEFMADYFHSQIEWPSSDDMRGETNCIDCLQDSEADTKTLTKEDLIKYVDNLLRNSKQILPALIYMGRMFENFQEHLLSEKINTVVLNYLLAVTESCGDTKSWPSFISEFRKVEVLHMFFHNNTDLTFCLEHASSSLIFDNFENIEEYFGEVNLTVETCNFMSEYFKEHAGLGHQKSKEDSNVIPFSS